ncbi:MAG: beta-ketoacyl synthase N-terminal-like domain-containing protein [Acidimicrobiales bacterium]
MSDAIRSHASDAAPDPIGRNAPVSITGIGAVTGYGWGRKHLWDGFLLGESAVKLVTGLDGYLEGGQAYLSLIADEGDRSDGPSRFMRAVRFAAREAITDAMERGWKPGPVVGVVHSLEKGDIDTWSEFYRSGESRVRPKKWVNMMPSTVISQMMKENDFHGPAMSVSAMCASANAAMITAKSWLDTGIASDVILLATDLSGMPQNLRAFRDLGVAVLDTPPFDACRPFQEGSRGFVGGEAAVAMVLSTNQRGSYATVLGGGMTMDAYNLVGVAPDLQEMFRCFRIAVASAGIEPDDVAYLNAHGPGTGMCDAAEAKILDELFPDASGIYSVKPLIGHCQSAAAAVETLATIYSFQTGFIPAPPRVAPGHPKLVDGRTPRVPGVTLKSALGMGGYNTVVALGEPDG